MESLSEKRPLYRWVIVALLFAAIVISYVDRQTIGLLKGSMSKDMGWSNSDFANIHMCFQAAYAVFYLVWGRVVDRIGARMGFALAFAIWSVAQIATAGAQRISHFMIARVALGVGESGAFPSAIKAVTEWFPQKERALANGIFNSGSNIGAIITPLIVPLIAVSWGWHVAFIVTGLAGLVWLPVWYLVYRRPREHKALTPAELRWIEQDGAVREAAPKMKWSHLIRHKQTWAYALGKCLTDPIFGMYLVWLPDFLSKRYHLNLKTVGWPLVAIYLLSDVGSVSGGWLSSHLLKRGLSVNTARKLTLAVCAACAMPVMLAPLTSQLWITVLIIGTAAAAHQGFSATLYALPGDLIPRAGTGSVVGIGGLFGAGAGILMSKYTGFVLDHGESYLPVFIVAGLAYWAALGLIHLLSPRLEALRA